MENGNAWEWEIRDRMLCQDRGYTNLYFLINDMFLDGVDQQNTACARSTGNKKALLPSRAK